MNRVVVLGPGAAGKSTFARALAAATGIPLTELDQVYWPASLEPRSLEEWRAMQADLVAPERWILDGDLGPYDVLEVRLRRADAVVLFDLPTWRCAWRAFRRSRQRLDFWRWLLTWRRRYRPMLLSAIDADAPGATVHRIRRPAEADDLLRAARQPEPPPTACRGS